MLRTKNTRISAIGLGGVAILGWLLVGSAPAQAATSLSCGVHLQGQPVMVNGSTRPSVTDTSRPACSAGDSAAGIFRVGASQPVDVPYLAEASASADLRTGQIKLVTDTQSAHVYAQASVRMVEDITIFAPGATAANPTAIKFVFDVDGDVEPSLLSNNAFQRWAGQAGLSATITPSYGRDYLFGAQYHGDRGILTSAYGDWRYGKDSRPVLNTNGQFVANYTGLPTSFELTFLQQFETVSFNLMLQAQATDNANFGHTIGTRLVLPQGVSFTSASGLFLTQSPGAVPEPATWAMMIGGFGLVGATMRRRGWSAAALA